MRRLIFCVAAGIVLIGVVEVKAEIYNARQDFSHDNNPNGVWSYGYSNSLGGGIILYPDNVISSSGFATWRDDRNVIKIPHVTLVDGTNAGYTYQPDELNFHPGRYGEISIIRWTAPTDGIGILEASYAGGFGTSTGARSVHVYHNSTSLFNADLAGDDAASYDSDTLLLHAGDTIDWEVKAIQRYGDACSTPVIATIDFTSVTEITDFNEDGNVDLADLDLLAAEANLPTGLAVPEADAKFDLNLDDVVNSADLNRWLEWAAAANGLDSPYLRGDANLDGDVDVFAIDGTGDAQVLTSNLGTMSGAVWGDGDFNGDGDVDVWEMGSLGDAQLLVSNMGAAHDVAVMAVPEPSSLTLLLLGAIVITASRQRRRK